MNETLLKQTRREYPPWQRFLMLAMLAPLFIVLIPAVLIGGSRRLDRALHLPRLPGGRPIQALGGLMAVAGWLLGVWSVKGQFDLGRGTPVPLMATQRLVVEPPYTVTRNPMALGAIGMYLGVAVAQRPFARIGLVFAAGSALLHLQGLVAQGCTMAETLELGDLSAIVVCSTGRQQGCGTQ